MTEETERTDKRARRRVRSPLSAEELQEALYEAIDAMGYVATKIGQHTVNIELHDGAIRKLEVSYARVLGMLAVIVFEIPLAIGAVYFIFRH